MGVKWTYVLFCILGTTNFFVVANPVPESVARIRESRAIDNFAGNEFEAAKSTVQNSSRKKRDVSRIVDDNGNQIISARSSGDNGHSFSYAGTTGTGTASASSSTSSNGGNGFGFVTSRIGAGESFDPFRGSSHNAGNSWVGPGSTRIPTSSSWTGGNQNYYPNVGSNPYYPNQYSGSYGGSSNQYTGPYGGYEFNIDDLIQQQFRAIQAQQQALQAQFQHSQPRQTSGNYSWGQAVAYTGGSNGLTHPKTTVNSYSTTIAATRSTGEFESSRDHSRQHYDAANLGYGNQNRFNSFGFNNGGGFSNGFDGFGSWNPGISRGGFNQQEFNFPKGGNSAVASSSLGPGGGFQYAEINPAAPGIVSRIAETHPPASGNNVQTFSSSSSSSVLRPDGTVSNRKSASSGINDNGKVTVYTVKDR